MAAKRTNSSPFTEVADDIAIRALGEEILEAAALLSDADKEALKDIAAKFRDAPSDPAMRENLEALLASPKP